MRRLLTFEANFGIFASGYSPLAAFVAMNLSKKAEKIYNIASKQKKLGDLRNTAKEIKKDHALAIELWSTGNFKARLLSILIMDPKVLDDDGVQKILSDIDTHESSERLQLADWFMANQLTKSKKTLALIESWEDSPSAIERRIFWYHQGRLRWVGQTPPNNTEQLLKWIEKKILSEDPIVQWAMNFTAGWIGVFDSANRKKCIQMGERLGLYKDEVVAKNCTPNYLPKFIEIEARKRRL